jgi:predicted nucleic acid-binding protein
MRLAGISASLATHAAELAGRHRLRGADSVYVAVACAYGADLITLDHEMLARGAAAVPTFAPMDWLGRHGTAGTGAAP